MSRDARRTFTLIDGAFLILATAVAVLPGRHALAILAAHCRRIGLQWVGDPAYRQRIFLDSAPERYEESISTYATSIFGYFNDGSFPTWPGLRIEGAAQVIAQDLELLLYPPLFLWTLTLLVLRLSAPRPTPGEMLRQPGFAACLAATVMIFFAPKIEPPVGSRISFWAVAGSIILAWGTLVTSRGWRAEPSWLDRSGRALGVAWIGLGLLSFAVR